MGINVVEMGVADVELTRPLECLCAEGLAKQERRNAFPPLGAFASRSQQPANHHVSLALHSHFQNEQAFSSDAPVLSNACTDAVQCWLPSDASSTSDCVF